MAIELRRSHLGKVTMYVNGQPASAARFGGIQDFAEGQCAVFIVPLKHVAFGEVDNVVPFVRPAPKPVT